MARRYDTLTPELAAFVTAQPVYFVASAPLAGDGHVNLSPKGLDTFRVLSERRVAYLDLTGSGNETAAHMVENGRLTMMFCAFDGRPLIVRLYGRGRVVLPGEPEWEELIALFPGYPGARQIIVSEIEFVMSSCGFGVPEMTLVGERDLLQKWAEKKGPEGIVEYRREKNAVSLDGLTTQAPASTKP